MKKLLLSARNCRFLSSNFSVNGLLNKRNNLFLQSAVSVRHHSNFLRSDYHKDKVMGESLQIVQEIGFKRDAVQQTLKKLGLSTQSLNMFENANIYQQLMMNESESFEINFYLEFLKYCDKQLCDMWTEHLQSGSLDLNEISSYPSYLQINEMFSDLSNNFSPTLSKLDEDLEMINPADFIKKIMSHRIGMFKPFLKHHRLIFPKLLILDQFNLSANLIKFSNKLIWMSCDEDLTPKWYERRIALAIHIQRTYLFMTSDYSTDLIDSKNYFNQLIDGCSSFNYSNVYSKNHK